MKSVFLKLVIASTLLLPASQLNAAEPKGKVPPVILNGLKAYTKSGPQAAVKTWIEGSVMEKKKEEALTYSETFKKVEEFYGSYRGYHLIGVTDITEITKVVTITMDYDKGPVFIKFLTYKTKNGWILVSFDFNTNPDVILPGLLLK